MNDRKKPNWIVVRDFEEGGILVEVSMSDTTRPMYNVRVGRRGERGTIPFLPLRTEGQGRVRVVSVESTVADLLRRAEAFVEEQAQAREDEYIQQRIEREARQVEKEGKKRRPSGYKQRGNPAA